jgi:HEAT repeat protein
MPDDKQFLNDIQSSDPNVRFAAWRRAGDQSPSVIPELGKLVASKDPGIAKAAREALTTMTHSVGKDTASANRQAVIGGLSSLTSSGQPVEVRIHALRLMSNIAGGESLPVLSKLLGSSEVREEAIYAIERIPGPASDKTLISAYKEAPDDFKPRVLAALGHRRVAEAAELAAEASRSSNGDIALAGARAFGRIGKKISASPKPVEMDSMLRYADAQAKEGGTAEAMRVYKTALDAPEPHLQCAAIIGIAKLGTPEAAAAIMPKLKSGNRTVRITAQNAWKSMAG